MKATIYSVLFASFIAATFARDVPKLMEAFTATVRKLNASAMCQLLLP